MSLLLRIALRNLLRQKRRNLLLGSAIAIGMALLLLANAFAHGISDVLFNRIMAFVTGHVSINFIQNGNRMNPLFRDGERMREIVAKAAPEAVKIEDAIGIFARAVGHGRSDNVILVSMNLKTLDDPVFRADLEANFRMVEGGYEALARGGLGHPVIIAEDKAKYLRVKLNDDLRVRFQDVEGRQQAVRLTVAGIFKPANAFMSAPVFLGLGDLKALAGYGPHDSPMLYLTLADSKHEAVGVADRLHRALKPGLARIAGSARRGSVVAPVDVYGYRIDSASRAATGLPAKGVFASAVLAESLGLSAGDTCRVEYAAKYPDGREGVSFVVTGVLPESLGVTGSALLVADREFFAAYYGRWPAVPGKDGTGNSKDTVSSKTPWWNPDHHPALRSRLVDEWVLLERTRTTEELQKKWSDATRLKTKAVAVDVSTMYETASMVVKLETALNLITLVAVLVLFFIIQVGVINTLRMTLRERTREIGTMRAIGMQKRDVRDLFLFETLTLTAVAGLAGIALAFGGMRLLAHLHFETESNPIGMILVGGHLHFVPNLTSMTLYFLLILGISTATAYFPARRAAHLQPSDALRHYE